MEYLREFFTQTKAFLGESWWEITVALVLAVLCAAGVEAVFKPLRRLLAKKTALYEVVWKKSSSLKPEEILGIRGKPRYGFHSYYYPRTALDREIGSKCERNENVLVTGNPLCGKSRAIYQALITLTKPCRVIIPRLQDIRSPEDVRIPRCLGSGKKVLVLNDIDKYLEKQNFPHLLQRFLQRNIPVIASCRSGPEYDSLCKNLERSNLNISSVFGDPSAISRVSEDEAEEIAKQTDRKLPSTFDGNVGSIFVELDAMRERYKSCSLVEKIVLNSLKRLYYAGIYQEREKFFPRKSQTPLPGERGHREKTLRVGRAAWRVEEHGVYRRQKGLDRG